MSTAAWLVLLLPLVGAAVIGLGFKVLPGRLPGYVGTAMVGASFVCTVITFFDLQDRAEDRRQIVFGLYDYAVTTGVRVRMEIFIDPLAILMMGVVTGVSTLIHLYATGYMAGDKGYARFFAYLNFFVFSMLLLVMAGNFLLLIAGWAFVGAASYLLISFYYRRSTATAAGIKAFVINVVGDIGLVLGTYFIFRHVHALDYATVFQRVPQVFGHNSTDLVVGCLLLLVGAFAKSAQVPLHTWLPDAMEGPTPVSALIHAATMVTAGVYLIARMHPLFQVATTAADVGAVVGCLTLLIAGTIGLVVTDLKRVIAYSTMSQIGYMIMAVSASVYVGGLFHLMTHAFFKALLFMAAGSVIGAMGGAQDLNKMSGFRKAMPFTYACFVVGGLALSGVPPFSGFFSKDEILLGLAEQGGWHWILYVAGYLGAFLTAIYTWRMIFRAFHGEPCPEAQELIDGHIHHPHQAFNPANGEVEDNDVGFAGEEHWIAERGPKAAASSQMTLAMGVLAVLATLGGLLQIPHVDHVLDSFLDPTFADAKTLPDKDGLTWFGLVLGAVLGLAGIYVAYAIWVQRPALAPQIQQRFKPLHTLFVNKWYFDEAIAFLVERPFSRFGRFGQQTFERIFVDGTLVGGSTGLIRAGSQAVKFLQNGLLRAYAALLLVGGAVVILYFLLQS